MPKNSAFLTLVPAFFGLAPAWIEQLGFWPLCVVSVLIVVVFLSFRVRICPETAAHFVDNQYFHLNSKMIASQLWNNLSSKGNSFRGSIVMQNAQDSEAFGKTRK